MGKGGGLKGPYYNKHGSNLLKCLTLKVFLKSCQNTYLFGSEHLLLVFANNNIDKFTLSSHWLCEKIL